MIPILKLGKDRKLPGSYRSIALASWKTLERMVNSRLVWTLESTNLLSRFQ